MDDMPNTILSIVVVLIILAAGVSAFFMVYGGVGYTQEQVEIFSVSDPSVSKTCNLDWEPESIVSVEQYNGMVWVTVNSIHYSVSGSQVVVQPAGMSG